MNFLVETVYTREKYLIIDLQTILQVKKGFKKTEKIFLILITSIIQKRFRDQ